MLYKKKYIIDNCFVNISYKTLEQNVIKIQKKEEKPKPKYDKNDDFLFWIFYILIKGETEFEYIKKQKFSISQEFKINASLKIKTTKFNNRKDISEKCTKKSRKIEDFPKNKFF